MHNNDKYNLEELSKRISSGNASKVDKDLYARWLVQLDVDKEVLPYNEVEEKRLQFRQRFQSEYLGPKQRRTKLPVWFPAAAAAILILVTAIWFFIPHNQEKKKNLYSTTSTREGERKIITLSDGSKITLNNSSHLKYPDFFVDSLREVFLEGEAFFEIAHNERKPFIVRTGKLNIKVLGTSFDIRSYVVDSQIEVTVATGKVGVQAQSKKDSWMLIPGQQLSYNRNTGLVSRSIVTPSDYTGWQKGELIFKNETLESICKRLERWYAVKITIKGEALKAKKINLEQKNESLQNVLKMLKMVGEFNYEIKDKNVQIW